MVTKSNSGEQALGAMQKKNLEAAVRLAQMSIENSQRILELQVKAAKEIFEDGVANAQTLSEVKTPQEALELRSRYAQHSAEKMFACSRGIAEATAQMQSELGRLLSQQVSNGSQDIMAAMQSFLKGMPMNNHAAAETLSTTFEAARQTLEQVSKASAEAFSAFSAMPGSKITKR